MISIIVSTYKPENFSLFVQNVKNTIGDVVYEIVKIDNPGIMGICEAYNRGFYKAKHPYICFCHDDIEFETLNWGDILIELFKNNKKIGLIGVAGSTYKAWVPSGWGSPQMTGFPRLNLIQKLKDERIINYQGVNMSKEVEPVVALDGCWLCTTREVANQFQFDDKTFKSYHCYDVDYSLQVFSKYIVGVTSNILIKHNSEGSFSSDWLIETYKLHEKWKTLPLFVGDVGEKGIKEQEKIAYTFLLGKTIEFKVSYVRLLKILFSFKFLNMVGGSTWMQLFRWTAAGYFRAFLYQ